MANLIIDSSSRNKTTIYDYGEIMSIKPWSLIFTPGSTVLRIQTPNNFQIGDQVKLNNVVSKHSRLQNAISIKKNSLYARVNHINHGLGLCDAHDFTPINFVGPLSAVYAKNSVLPDSTQFYTPSTNLTANIITTEKVILNGLHKLFLLYKFVNGSYVMDPDAYVIDLIESANSNQSMSTPIDLTFGDIYGIPLDVFDNILDVVAARPDSFDVDLGIPAAETDFYTDPTLDQNLTEINKYNLGGPTEMYIQTVTGSKIGYPSASNFVISLPNTLTGVSQLDLTFSAIPNVQQNVTSTSNQLQWRVSELEDVYTLKLDPGRYSSQTLEHAIKLASNQVLRQIDTQENIQQNAYFMLDVAINSQTNIVEFSSWQEYSITDGINIPFGRINFEPNPQINAGTYLYVTPIGMIKPFLYRVVNEITADLDLNQRIIFYTDINELLNINNEIDLSKTIFDMGNSMLANATDLQVGDLIATNLMLPELVVRVFEVYHIVDSQAYIRLTDTKILYDSQTTPVIAINFPIDLLRGLGPAVGLPVYQPIVVIDFPNNFQIGDKITIFNAKSILYTPSVVLNKKHTIYAVSDTQFWIKLEPYNLLPQLVEQSTSNAVIGIRFKELLQLIFNDNSIGPLLGFQNTTHTEYAFTVTNEQQMRPSINFNPNGFFYVRSNAIGKPLYGTEFQNVVAIIYWIQKGLSSSQHVIYNSFAPISLKYSPPINLQQIDIYCTDTKGILIDFGHENFSLVFTVLH
jgi:hypothetical protein